MKQKILKLIGLSLVLAAAGWFIYGQPKPAVLGDFSVVGNASSTAELKLVFLDVGQGDAALILPPSGEQILVDGGPDKSAAQKLGNYLPPFDKKIEYVILTHPHSDHLTSLIDVLRNYEVGQVIMTGVAHTTDDYAEFLRLIKAKNIPTLLIDRQQSLTIGKMNLEFLAPAESFLGQKIDNLNNSSIVFKLDYASTSALFTGDYENEEELVSSSPAILKADVLKVGHHGSTNANDREFLKAVSPQFAVISVGADNKFGHPHYRTVYYLKQFGAQILRTDEQGDITLTSDGSSFKLK
jgi:competence protein ComEC